MRASFAAVFESTVCAHCAGGWLCCHVGQAAPRLPRQLTVTNCKLITWANVCCSGRFVQLMNESCMLRWGAICIWCYCVCVVVFICGLGELCLAILCWFAIIANEGCVLPWAAVCVWGYCVCWFKWFVSVDCAGRCAGWPGTFVLSSAGGEWEVCAMVRGYCVS